MPTGRPAERLNYAPRAMMQWRKLYSYKVEIIKT
jgi:hypothetical protein